MPWTLSSASVCLPSVSSFISLTTSCACNVFPDKVRPLPLPRYLIVFLLLPFLIFPVVHSSLVLLSFTSICPLLCSPYFSSPSLSTATVPSIALVYLLPSLFMPLQILTQILLFYIIAPLPLNLHLLRATCLFDLLLQSSFSPCSTPSLLCTHFLSFPSNLFFLCQLILSPFSILLFNSPFPLYLLVPGHRYFPPRLPPKLPMFALCLCNSYTFFHDNPICFYRFECFPQMFDCIIL